MNAIAQRSSEEADIRPFRVTVRETELAELVRRLNMTRWPERETVPDKSQGVQLATMQGLARYWATGYDWRKIEAKINSFPNFITEIDGLDIHFIHVRSKHEEALPLLISHGWPGTIIEQLKILEPLTNPTAYGGSAADAFHLVVPSMPGYGFSAKPTASGWGPARIARAWVTLMKRLGYSRYVAQGGDWGSLVTEQLAVLAPPGLMGIHTNMPGAVPPDLDAAAFTGAPRLTVDEQGAYQQLLSVYRHVYYAFYMASRPQTLTGLADSPVGLAAFLIDPDAAPVAVANFLTDSDSRSPEPIACPVDGWREGITRDDVLDMVTLFWLTNTGVSAARLYWENKLPYFAPKGISIPVAVSVFPKELYVCPRSWAERAYPKLIHYNKLDRGGHFAAWEQPKLFSEELQTGFRSLRA